MARIVRDSDDEGDNDSAIGSVKEHEEAQKDGNGALAEDVSAHLGSLDSFERAVRTSPDERVPSDPSAIRPSPALEKHDRETAPRGIKRPRTDIETLGLFSSPRSSGSKKVMKTYGRSKQRSDDMFNDLGDDLMSTNGLGRLSSVFSAQQGNSGDNHVNTEDANPTPPEGFSASMQVEFAQCDPQVMFPEQSSTVEDTSLTQRRLIQEALNGNAPAAQESSQFELLDGPENSSLSISCSVSDATSSGNLKPPPAGSNDPAEPVQTTTISEELMPRASQHAKRSSSSHASQAQPDIEAQTGHHSSTAKSFLHQPTRVEMGNKIASHLPSTEPDSADELSKMDKYSPRRSSTGVTPKPTKEPAVSEKLVPVIGVESAPRRKKRATSQADELNSDEIAIGLPREQYKPRPSRSRSTQVATQAEPIDWGARPEKATKKAKRRKTTDASTDISTLDRSAAIDVMREMGFSSSRARKALDEVDGDIDAAIGKLVGQSPVATRARKMGQNDQVSEDIGLSVDDRRKLNDDIEAVVEVRPQVDDKCPAKGEAVPSQQVDGAMKPPQATHKEPTLHHEPLKHDVEHAQEPSAKSTGTAVPEIRNQQQSNDDQKPLAPLPVKKRGRGRPRKEAQIEIAQEEPSKDDPEKSAPIRVSQSTHAREALTEKVVNVQITPTDDPVAFTEDSGPLLSTPRKMPPSSPPQVLQEKALEKSRNDPDVSPQHTPQKATKAAGSTPTQNSSVKTSGPAYRVGLSRRTRIAPLLKVVRK